MSRRYNREGYRFSKTLRHELISRSEGKCERCHKEAPLEVHHILPIEIARECYPNLPPMIVTSALNAMCLCERCHEKMDVLARDPDYVEVIISVLEQAAFESQDDEVQEYLRLRSLL